MKRKLLFIIPLFFISLLFVNVAGATWSLSESSGSWKSLSVTEWESFKDSNYCDAVYTKSDVNIATSWVFALSLKEDTWFDWREFWVSHKIEHTAIFNLTNAGKKVSIKIVNKVTRNLQNFGLGKHWIGLYYCEDNDDYTTILSGKTSLTHYRFYFFKESATVLNVTVVALMDRDGQITRQQAITVDGVMILMGWLFTHDFTVPSGWFDSLDLSQKMVKEHDGWIHGYKDSESFDVVTEPTETTATSVDWLAKIWETITTPIYNMLPSWARAIIDVFTGIGMVFVNVILPNLAVLLSAYILINLALGFQTLSDSFTEMSDLNIANFKDIILDAFKPLYDLFLWIFNFMVRVGQILAEILPF